MKRLKTSFNLFRDLMERQGILVFIMVFVILFLIFLSPLIIWKIFNIQFILTDNAKPIADELTFLYYVLITTITAIIALFTYKQFNHFNENMKIDYLLKIDKRWGSREIIKARMVIHNLYLKAKDRAQTPNITDEMLRLEIGKDIIQLSESRAGFEAEEAFVHLLNLLDFMETIGYFYSKRQLSEKDLIELFGDSIKFIFEVFKPYIYHRRKNHGRIVFSKEFEKLYLTLQC
jgi:hypothetical protein